MANPIKSVNQQDFPVDFPVDFYSAESYVPPLLDMPSSAPPKSLSDRRIEVIPPPPATGEPRTPPPLPPLPTDADHRVKIANLYASLLTPAKEWSKWEVRSLIFLISVIVAVGVVLGYHYGCSVFNEALAWKQWVILGTLGLVSAGMSSYMLKKIHNEFFKVHERAPEAIKDARRLQSKNWWERKSWDEKAVIVITSLAVASYLLGASVLAASHTPMDAVNFLVTPWKWVASTFQPGNISIFITTYTVAIPVICYLGYTAYRHRNDSLLEESERRLQDQYRKAVISHVPKPTPTPPSGFAGSGPVPPSQPTPPPLVAPPPPASASGSGPVATTLGSGLKSDSWSPPPPPPLVQGLTIGGWTVPPPPPPLTAGSRPVPPSQPTPPPPVAPTPGPVPPTTPNASPGAASSEQLVKLPETPEEIRQHELREAQRLLDQQRRAAGQQPGRSPNGVPSTVDSKYAKK